MQALPLSGYAPALSSEGQGAACRAGDKRAGEGAEGGVVKRRPGDSQVWEGADCAFVPVSPRWRVRRRHEAVPRSGQFQALAAMSRGLWQQAVSGSDKLTDVRFLFPGGAALRAHRGVLSARSKALRGMFESEMEEALTGDVRISDSSAASFLGFLSYIYLGCLGEECGGADGRELWALADKYEVEELREQLLGDIDEHNVAAAAQFAREVRDGRLAAACEHRAKALLRLITADALRGIESTVAWALMPDKGEGLDAFRFAQRWFEANSGGVGGHVQPLVRKVDFSTISSLDLRAVVRPSGLVSAEQLVDLYEGRLNSFPWASQDFRPMSFRGEGLLNTPVGIASRDDSTVVVADRMNSRVLVLGPKGDFSVLLPKDANSLKFRDPVGIAIGPTGNIAVTDVLQERVLEFTAQGDFVQAFGTAGKGHGQFSGLRGITINRVGEFIVSDENNHRIQMFAHDGAFLNAFGSLGHDNGQLCRPFGVAVAPDSSIIVADQGNARIAIFTPQGTFLRAFGLPFVAGEGRMDPAFVAVSISGDIVVSDFVRNRVHVFSAEGVLLKTIGGEGEVQFLGPCGVAVGSNGSIIVADSGHSRLSILGKL